MAFVAGSREGADDNAIHLVRGLRHQGAERSRRMWQLGWQRDFQFPTRSWPNLL
jgi:hypothetical protein